MDYGLGNLFSVAQACTHVGMSPVITSEPREVSNADVVILPGVGAFGDAMEHLKRLDLVSPLRDVAQSDKPLIAICLGMQLLMTESYEFGRHAGLGIIAGSVVHLADSPESSRHSDNQATARVKVPQVGWNRIFRQESAGGPKLNGLNSDHWASSPLSGLGNGEFMYFVHSYHVEPEDASLVLSVSRYGESEFCSSLHYRNIFGFQFHPERSGLPGLQIYRNIQSSPN